MPVKDETTLRRTVALADDILIRTKGFDGHGQAAQGLPLLVRESGQGLQLSDEPVDMLRIVHGILPCLCRRECIELSGIGACDQTADASTKIALAQA